MQPTSETLGVCPDCGVAIPSRKVLIEYERGEETAIFAECPDCAGVIHPA